MPDPYLNAATLLQRRDVVGVTPLREAEFRVSSQNGEDGVLLEMIKRIFRHLQRPVGPGRFFEFGASSGAEANCVFLADWLGWSGVFIDGDAAAYNRLERKYRPNSRVRTGLEKVTAANINALWGSHGLEPLDVLSIDIDGLDYWVWKAVEFAPLIVVIEYNASLREGSNLVLRPDYDLEWDGSTAFGASIGALRSLGHEKNYTLVHTDLAGVNCFFVRNDFVDLFPEASAPALRGANYLLESQGHPETSAQVFVDPSLDPPAQIVRTSVDRVGDIEIEVHTAFDEFITGDLLREGVWEPFETSVFTSLCHDGDVVLDIGANIGWYSILASRLVGPTGSVFAFEPDAINYELLLRNVARNAGSGQFYPDRLAVGKATTEGTMYFSDTNLGDHHMFDDGTDRESTIVQVMSLDDIFLPRSGSRSWPLPTIVKSDTQGCEAEILEGGRALFERGWRPIFLMEFWPYGLALSGSDPMYVWTLCESMGYEMYELAERNTRLIPLTREEVHASLEGELSVEDRRFINILALPPDFERASVITQFLPYN